MGTFGTKLFDDDVACDVRDEYVDLLASGKAPEEATMLLQEQWALALLDADDGPTFWLALASTQWKYGVLLPDVRERALAVIASGADLARWGGGAEAARRARVLAALQRTLESPPPRPRRPRRRRPRAPRPTHSTLSPAGRSTATVWQISQPHERFGPIAQVLIETDSRMGRGGGHVCVLRGLYDQVELQWEGEDTLVVRYPAGVPLEDPRPTFRFVDTTIECRYETIADPRAQGERI